MRNYILEFSPKGGNTIREVSVEAPHAGYAAVAVIKHFLSGGGAPTRTCGPYLLRERERPDNMTSMLLRVVRVEPSEPEYALEA